MSPEPRAPRTRPFRGCSTTSRTCASPCASACWPPIAALNYRPLTSARSLATNRSFMIGLLYDNRSPSYIMEVQAGVLEACEAQHYSMMVQPLVSTAPDFVERVDDILSRHRPDGLILTPPITDHPQLAGIPAQERHARLPRSRRCTPKDCIGVILREREAARRWWRTWCRSGHRRIAHILGDPEHGAGVWRLAGYRDGLKRAGLRKIRLHGARPVLLRIRRGRRAPIAGACGRGPPPYSRPTTTWPSARSGPLRRRGCRCRATFPSAASTIPRSRRRCGRR